MKVFAALILTLVATSALASNNSVTLEKACYKATNPEVISADNFEEGKALITSTGTRATLVLETSKYAEAEENQKTAKMKISTNKNWRVDVWSGIYDPEQQKTVPTYQVECDGGSMTVKSIDESTLILNSDYIAGEMKSGPEGCSNARMKFKNLVMKKRACK